MCSGCPVNQRAAAGSAVAQCSRTGVEAALIRMKQPSIDRREAELVRRPASRR